MNEQTQPKATVIRVFKRDSVELRLTEKGAVTVYRNTDRGIQFCHSLKPSDVKLHAELGSPSFQEIIQSPEWMSVQENKEVNKAKQYIEREKAKALSTALKYKQAAFDKLTAMGLSQDQIESILKVG